MSNKIFCGTDYCFKVIEAPMYMDCNMVMTIFNESFDNGTTSVEELDKDNLSREYKTFEVWYEAHRNTLIHDFATQARNAKEAGHGPMLLDGQVETLKVEFVSNEFIYDNPSSFTYS